MNTSVYILTDHTNDHLKIGIANDVLARWCSFGYADIHHEDSFELICNGRSSAYKIEKMLHSAFNEDRIASTDIGNVDGKDEWFQLSVLNEVIELIKIRLPKDSRMLEFKKGIVKPILADKPTRRFPSKEERQVKLVEESFKADTDNEESIKSFLNFLKTDLHNEEIYYKAEKFENSFHDDTDKTAFELYYFNKDTRLLSDMRTSGIEVYKVCSKGERYYGGSYGFVSATAYTHGSNMIRCYYSTSSSDFIMPKTTEAFKEVDSFIRKFCKPLESFQGKERLDQIFSFESMFNIVE